MDFKFCVDCGTKNVVNAKYCFGCGFNFSELGSQVAPTNVSAPTAKPTPKTTPKNNTKQTLVFDTNENDGENEDISEVEIDNDYVQSFAELVIKKGGGGVNKGVKMGEVFNTVKPTENRNVLSKRRNEGPKTVKSILQGGANTSKRRKQKEE